MSGRRNNFEANDNNTRDEGLTALFRAWKNIEPDAGFEEGVWRRIRGGQIHDARDVASDTAIREWAFWRSFGSVATAAAAAMIVVGLLAFLMPASERGHHVPSALLHPRTLAGSYLSMAAGEMP